MTTRKKSPPPDNPGNLAGRKAARRASAWATACGGIKITLGTKGERPDDPRGMYTTYKPPDDVQERFKAELARVERAWARRSQERAEPPSPKPKKEPPPDGEGVDMAEFLLE